MFMAYRIVIHRHGFEVYTGKAKTPSGTIHLDPRSNLSVFVALLWRFHEEGKMFSIEEFRKIHVWRDHKDKRSAQRILSRYVGEVEELEWQPKLIRVARGTGVSKGTYYLSVMSQTKIEVSEELNSILFPRENEAEDWRSYPPHQRRELMHFVGEICESAIDFDIGDVSNAAKTLAEALNKIDSPFYRAVVLMRLSRAKFRLGMESDANENLIEAERLVEQLTSTDEILRARVAYNRAWFAYTMGEFDYRNIAVATRALLAAGPDDIRHGYVLSLHGLLVVKDIERNYRNRETNAIHDKVSRAVCYLTHGIYLLARSEDFWGTQEACWNLAYALYRLGNLSSLRFPDPTGFLGHDAREILDWIELSSEIMRIHNTGNDSLRNFVLRASVYLTRMRNFREADTAFADADEFLKGDKSKRQKPRPSTPRELGRLHEQRVLYFLMLATEPGQDAEECKSKAADEYKLAEAQWKPENLKSLLQNELEARYDYDEDTHIVKLRGNSRP
jgi:hypothetical protein